MIWMPGQPKQVQHLWGYVPRGETCATGRDDEVDGMGGITDPRVDRLTDEQGVIGHDCGLEDEISTAGEEGDCGGAGGVQRAVCGGCIAHGQHGCGRHGVRGWVAVRGFG